MQFSKAKMKKKELLKEELNNNFIIYKLIHDIKVKKCQNF